MRNSMKNRKWFNIWNCMKIIMDSLFGNLEILENKIKMLM